MKAAGHRLGQRWAWRWDEPSDSWGLEFLESNWNAAINQPVFDGMGLEYVPRLEVMASCQRKHSGHPLRLNSELLGEMIAQHHLVQSLVTSPFRSGRAVPNGGNAWPPPVQAEKENLIMEGTKMSRRVQAVEDRMKAGR